MKKWYSYALCCAMAILLVSCAPQHGDSRTEADGGTSPRQETALEKARREGYVTVGFANEKPYAYATPDGQLTGEAVEVAREVLKRMGIEEMNGVLTEFGSLIPGLKAKRFDIITAGMFINPERSKEVAFANPEYSIGEALAVKKGNPSNLRSYEDIAGSKDVKVAVMVGAIELEYLAKSGVSKEQIVTVPDQPSAISALQAGRVDAVTMTGPSLQAMLDSTKDDQLERVMDFEQPEIEGKSVRGYGAAAFRKEDADFREAFNQELEALKQSGKLLELLEPFGFTEQELPGDMTAERLWQE
ncbi:ectoine/hydroxyectoine ABC transporter substrate-binding protein EhuB [Paenibacillus melissococcoides]|uniref:Ectoine/hydroxyectoine ABC transporter substrate-binding protein EhuB n=1 Tax=Paenibacillus melissococcoides TaxID=2912268 RepID=A0ABN8U9U6_9BACL|nr:MULTISPECIES: ectoine/hydroxyectoine ABC transporter substrate-binding protein EhuB [Paenibacillus]MEB9893908.1 ectoine/hydroxyectoine ABC transporter substrate-binding protein EhuB [Bacillus cereus]CAH8247961.1 ectoine/hydroxyectoine ABC transporter substrate-binding protein EhuB [Paenibacillus melissococcoides]CAH8719025.1 ectoine/hydroxyectoine ABC transporter substrate-binding protein EhuB [Paenibacillus melissococcoides]CAH8720033.1 ectoine/hydroxyectoine ABC transporter substrate-bindi